MKLPHHNRITETVPDCMHTLRVEKVFHLLTGRKDTAKVRRSEMKVNRFGLEPALTASGTKQGLEQTPCYRLSISNLLIVE